MLVTLITIGNFGCTFSVYLFIGGTPLIANYVLKLYTVAYSAIKSLITIFTVNLDG